MSRLYFPSTLWHRHPHHHHGHHHHHHHQLILQKEKSCSKWIDINQHRRIKHPFFFILFCMNIDVKIIFLLNGTKLLLSILLLLF